MPHWHKLRCECHVRSNLHDKPTVRLICPLFFPSYYFFVPTDTLSSQQIQNQPYRMGCRRVCPAFERDAQPTSPMRLELRPSASKGDDAQPLPSSRFQGRMKGATHYQHLPRLSNSDGKSFVFFFSFLGRKHQFADIYIYPLLKG